MYGNIRLNTTQINCLHCGAPLKVDQGRKIVRCEYCGATFTVPESADDAEKKYAPLPGLTGEIPPPRKRRTLLWVLGWIFIFPVPLTILMLRNRRLPKAARFAIIALGWAVYLLLSLGRTGTMEDRTTQTASEPTTVTETAVPPSASAAKPSGKTTERVTEGIWEELPEEAGTERSFSEAVTPEFKEAMDSYEAFFDEYMAFLKLLDEDPSDMSLLIQYADFMSR